MSATGHAVGGGLSGGGEGVPFVLTSVEALSRWAQRNSMWPLTMGLACCAIEMMALVTPRFDVARFGAEVFRGSPRQADLMIVSGRVCHKMVPVIRQLYGQMAEPRWVVSMGACACSGGTFNNYAVVQGVDQILPVDVYVPGCPPTPEAVLQALVALQQRIADGAARPRDRRVGPVAAGIVGGGTVVGGA